MSDLKDSVRKTIKDKSVELRNIIEDIGKLNNYKQTLETQIKGYYEIYNIGIDEIDVVKLIEVVEPKKIPLKKLLDIFPNYDIRMILENVVCEIDIDLLETEINFRYSEFQDSLIKAIIKQLKRLTNESVKKGVIK